MSLKKEIREELEEKARKNENHISEENNEDDKNFHGIGWNILHGKFVDKN